MEVQFIDYIKKNKLFNKNYLKYIDLAQKLNKKELNNQPNTNHKNKIYHENHKNFKIQKFKNKVIGETI